MKSSSAAGADLTPSALPAADGRPRRSRGSIRPGRIWYFIATQSHSIDIADRLIDSITARFVLLGNQPHIGRRRDQDLRPGVRTFTVGDYVIGLDPVLWPLS